MHPVLAAISNGEDVGDVTTLANPEVVEEIKKIVAGCAFLFMPLLKSFEKCGYIHSKRRALTGLARAARKI